MLRVPGSGKTVEGINVDSGHGTSMLQLTIRVFGEDPRDGDLSSRSSIFPCDGFELVHEFEVVGKVILIKTRQEQSQIIRLKVGARAESGAELLTRAAYNHGGHTCQ